MSDLVDPMGRDTTLIDGTEPPILEPPRRNYHAVITIMWTAGGEMKIKSTDWTVTWLPGQTRQDIFERLTAKPKFLSNSANQVDGCSLSRLGASGDD